MERIFKPIELATIEWKNNIPFSSQFQEAYFSKDACLETATNFFIEENQLISRWKTGFFSSFVIGETAFGCGLNFLLTWSYWLKYAPHSATLYFFSGEKFPLSKAYLTQCCALWPHLKQQADALLANYPVLTPGFHYLQFAAGRVNLILMLGDITESLHQLVICSDSRLEALLRRTAVDAWFLNGFDLAKNPAMQQEDLFRVISLLSKPATTLATLLGTIEVKKNLQLVGFEVKHPGTRLSFQDQGIQATFRSPTEYTNYKWRKTPWHLPLPTPLLAKEALIIGAGLAGCYTAHALAKRGWKVKLLDCQSELAQGASGVSQAILYPKFSKYRSPLTEFMLTAYLYATRVYQAILTSIQGELSGIIQLSHSVRERKSQEALAAWFAAYPELGQLVDAKKASALAGIKLTEKALFIPLSGWLHSKTLCQWLAQTPGIEWIPATEVMSLYYEQDRWHANDFSAPNLIIANGYRANQFSQTSYVPLKPMAGQMTFVADNSDSLNLKRPLCGESHIFPSHQSMHALGATYRLNSVDNVCLPEDDLLNLSGLHPISTIFSSTVTHHWREIRGATPDYMPAVGPIPHEEQFMHQFEALSKDSNRWIPAPGSYYPGLFMCAGFGSRGFTSIPLSAEWLASFMNHEADFLPQAMIKNLSPARFLRKQLITRD